MPAFRAKVEEYLGGPLADPKPVAVHAVDDHLGWHEQGEGKLFLGIPVENGRIKDEGTLRLASGLRALFEKYGNPARLTCQQSILLIDLEPAWRADIEAILQEYGIATVEHISTVRRWSMACPALPTCGLAITESERVLPSLVDQLEATLAELGLANEVFTLRMTGCPNGCARPYNCDIGLVGKTKDKYTILLGGRRQGDRLNFIFRDLVPTAEVVPALSAVLRYFRAARQSGETLGDFCHRVGKDDLLANCPA
jgi:sulfite reductase (ferredoxin)